MVFAWSPLGRCGLTICPPVVPDGKLWVRLPIANTHTFSYHFQPVRRDGIGNINVNMNLDMAAWLHSKCAMRPVWYLLTGFTYSCRAMKRSPNRRLA